MSRYPKFNFPAFYKVAARLRAGGHTVFNPAENDVQRYGEDFHAAALASVAGDPADLAKFGFSKRQVLEDDTQWICRHAEAIAMLPGWKKKRSSRMEHALGLALDLLIYEIPKDWLK